MAYVTFPCLPAVRSITNVVVELAFNHSTDAKLQGNLDLVGLKLRLEQQLKEAGLNILPAGSNLNKHDALLSISLGATVFASDGQDNPLYLNTFVRAELLMPLRLQLEQPEDVFVCIWRGLSYGMYSALKVWGGFTATVLEQAQDLITFKQQ